MDVVTNQIVMLSKHYESTEVNLSFVFDWI